MKRFYIHNQQNEQLAATLFETSEQSEVTIICHPQESSQENILLKDLTEYLAKQNKNIITFDYSGHGLSEGESNESSTKKQIQDLDSIIKYANKNFRQIGLIGYDSSAVTNIIYTAQNPTITHNILISPNAQSADDLSNFEESIQRCISPKLFCHGTKDETIPSSETEQIFRESPEPKELFLILDADHQFNITRQRENLFLEINSWINSLH